MSEYTDLTREKAALESATTTAQAHEAMSPTDDDNLRQEDPWVILGYVAITLFIMKMWWDDFNSNRKGKPNDKAFPGATSCTSLAVWIAVSGALILLGLETAGEYALGISEEQSDITKIFLLSMIAAAFIEELIFRGFLVIENKGKAALIGSMLAFSFLFAILHPHLWQMDFAEGVPAWQFWHGQFSLDFSVKAFFSTGSIFVGSLWFYAMRFNHWNPKHSLIPCFAAHLVKNIGVFVIKLAQGHVV